MKISPQRLFPVLAVLIVAGTYFSIRFFEPENKDPFRAADILEFRRIKNRMLAGSVGSPFYRVLGFDSLRYFPPNPEEVFVTDFQPVQNGETLDLLPDMPGIPSHVMAGYAIIRREEISDTLYLLKSTREQSDSVFFIPFSDASNGKETYGGGRYLDVILRRGRPLLLDFNYASNPYCAYRADFICPRIPAFNQLGWPVRAGEKNYPESH
jgi:uncharacterized protein (DUF1684 family)